MNMNPNLLRANSIGQAPAMLGMNNGPFMQNPGQLSQSQLGQNPMNMSGGINGNPSMNVLSNSLQQQRYFNGMQPNSQQLLPQQGRPMMRPGPGPQSMLPTANQAGALHMAGLNPQMQSVGVGFPGQGMANQQQVGPNGLRRVPSQTHLPGSMSSAVSGGMSMGLPQQMPQHMQQQHMRMHQQRQAVNAARGPGGGGQMINATMGGGGGGGQIMSSLQQPGSIGPQPHPGFQGSPNGVPVTNQQSQLAPSPRPNSIPLNALGMPASGPTQIPVNRASMTPDNSNPIGFVNYPGPQFSGAGGMGPRGPSQANAFPFPPPSTPPMQDSADSPLSVGMMSQGTPNSQPRAGFPTPAQQLQMNSMNPSTIDPFSGQPQFSMAPPSSVPPRPPSHTPAMTPHPMNPQMQQHQQHQHQPTPQPSQPAGTPIPRASPLPSGPSDQIPHPSRPQSRPQSQPQHHPNAQHTNQATPSRAQTPRSVHNMPMSPRMNNGGMQGASQPHQVGGRGGAPPPPPNQMQQAPVGGMGPQQQQQQQQPLQPQLTGGQQQSQQPGQQGMHGPAPPPQQGQQQQQHPGMMVRQPLHPPGSLPIPPAIGGMQQQVPGPLSATAASTAAANSRHNVIGSGQGLIRLLQFSGILSSENKNKLQLAWWNDLVKDYFTPKAIMKFTLWKDNQKNEAKPFEIGLPILPRFFLVTTQSGVKSMTLALDGARERIYAQGHAIVECVAAVWTYKYTNGYTVTLRGPLTAHVVVTAANPPNAQSPNSPGYVLKFEEFEFDATHHDKYIAIDAIMGARISDLRLIASTPGSVGESQSQDAQRQLEEGRVNIMNANIPGEPVNAFGIPQATMRCLELAESVGAMADLIAYVNETSHGPLEALSKFAAKLRENGAVLMLNPPNNNNNNPNIPPPHHPSHAMGGPMFQPMNSQQNGVFPQLQVHPQQPPQLITLYSSAPASVTNPQQHPQQPHNPNQTIPPPPQATTSSPRNTPSSASGSSPKKQHKPIPHNSGQQGQGSGSQASGSAASPSASPAGSTPALSNASLKRKQTSGTASPTTTNAEGPPAKRATRKRGRTNTTGAG